MNADIKGSEVIIVLDSLWETLKGVYSDVESAYKDLLLDIPEDGYPGDYHFTVHGKHGLSYTMIKMEIK